MKLFRSRPTRRRPPEVLSALPTRHRQTAMRSPKTIPSVLLSLLVSLMMPARLPAQQDRLAPDQLPAELRGAKVYRLPDDLKPGEQVEDPVIYRGMAYEDINLERLVLNLSLSVKPVDRAATIRRIHFQDFRVNGVPIHIEPYETEFKVSNKDVVDLPAPLRCSIVFADLESVKPLQEIVNRDSLRITGQSFVEVKLNVLEKIALRARRLVLPAPVDEEVPLEMFSGNPLLKMAANSILDTLTNPTTEAAAALAREHLEKVAEDRKLATLGHDSIYLLYCEYALRDPNTGTAETFSQSGTGFVIGADGKMLTAKRVIEPWKFDPQIAFLMKRYGLKFEKKSYRLVAWPAGARILSAQGQPDFEGAFNTEKKTLEVLKTPPDQMEDRDYKDPDTGEEAKLSLHAEGENDVALLRLTGEGFEPLALADPATELTTDLKTALLGFPFALSQSEAEPRPLWVQASWKGPSITLDHAIDPGESGAPLVTAEGKVLGISGGSNECIPVKALQNLIK
jgi:hypothetical protein